MTDKEALQRAFMAGVKFGLEVPDVSSPSCFDHLEKAPAAFDKWVNTTRECTPCHGFGTEASFGEIINCRHCGGTGRLTQ